MTVVNVYPAANDNSAWDELAELSQKLLTHIYAEMEKCENSKNTLIAMGDGCEMSVRASSL